MVSRLSIITLVLCASTLLRAQDPGDDLTILPPMPNLYLGDPERPLSGKMKRALAREEERKRRAAEAERSAMVPYGAEEEADRDGKLFKKPILKRRQDPVHNSISSVENARTTDGSLIRPFGQPDYWGGIPEAQEEDLALLPPMPDLRTSDQVTKREKRRDKAITRFEERKLANEEARMKREERRTAEVRTFDADPSRAHVHVSSYEGAPYSGIQAAPATNRTTLKPFNENSAYYENGMLMSQGKPKRDPNRFQLFRKKGE